MATLRMGVVLLDYGWAWQRGTRRETMKYFPSRVSHATRFCCAVLLSHDWAVGAVVDFGSRRRGFRGTPSENCQYHRVPLSGTLNLPCGVLLPTLT